MLFLNAKFLCLTKPMEYQTEITRKIFFFKQYLKAILVLVTKSYFCTKII